VVGRRWMELWKGLGAGYYLNLGDFVYLFIGMVNK
jgi:hypothetical protein